MGFPYFFSFLPTLLLSAMYAWLTYQLLSPGKEVTIVKKWQWMLLSAAYVVVMKGSFLVEFSTSPDEHQWIFSARTFAQDPWNWFKEYYPYEMSRSWTVIPLGVLAAIVGELTYVHARVLFLLFFGLNMGLLYFTMKKRFSDRTVLMAISWFVVLYSMTIYVDYAAYNSEMPALSFILISLFFLFRLLDAVEVKSSASWLAMCSVFIPFAKEQALYIALFIWMMGAIHLIKRSAWSLLVRYIGCSVVVALLLISPLVYFGTLDVFIQNASIAAQYQSNGFGMVEKDLINPSFVLYFFQLVFLNAMWFFPFLLLLFFAFIVFKVNGWKIKFADWTGRRDALVLIITAVVLLTIYLPRNGIKHYCIFLIPSVIWAVAFALDHGKESKRWFAVMWILPFGMCVDPHFRKEIFPVKGYRSADVIFSNDPVYQGMKAHVRPGSKVMIWGWANHYYNLFQCQRCSHYLYPQFAFGFYKETDFVNGIYINDLREFVPDYVVQAVGDGCFYFTDSVKCDMMAHNAQLASILREDYALVYQRQGVKIYAHH
jgi:hypothetical protein